MEAWGFLVGWGWEMKADPLAGQAPTSMLQMPGREEGVKFLYHPAVQLTRRLPVKPPF